MYSDVSRGGVFKALAGRMVLVAGSLAFLGSFLANFAVTPGQASPLTAQEVLAGVFAFMILTGIVVGIVFMVPATQYAARARYALNMARDCRQLANQAGARSEVSGALYMDAATPDEVTTANYVSALEDMAETAQTACRVWDGRHEEEDTDEVERMMDRLLCRLMGDLNRVGEYGRYPVGGFEDTVPDQPTMKLLAPALG